MYRFGRRRNDTSAPQSLDNPFGKILRLNTDGSIPTDNPFYNPTTGINRAIWAYGLRNPYTTAFQPGTGRFFINDVGQSSWEEIDEGSRGRNFGWPTTEGAFTQSQYPNFHRAVLYVRTQQHQRHAPSPAAISTIRRSTSFPANTSTNTSSPISPKAKFAPST